MTKNFSQWVNECGWDRDDLETAYKKVKLRRNIYGLLSLLTPLGIVLLPFWARAAYLTKVIKTGDMDSNLNPIIAFCFGISCILIYPFILMQIIKRTNWGMGINRI